MTAPLIDEESLADELLSPSPPLLLDVRWALTTQADRDGYLAGHLPGARFVDLDRDLAAPAGRGGRHPLPGPEEFGRAMRALGARADTPIVCYDAGPGTAAARAWWLLRVHGHPRVRVLNGGLGAWSAAGRALETGPVTAPPGDFVASGTGGEIVTADELPGFVERGGLLLDARDLERFLGRSEPVDPVAGHIPGAVSAPTTANLGGDGRFLAADALRARFGDLGAGPGRPVAVYCGSGVTAAHQVLALESAGIRARLYPGSWSHWITDPARPVATGP